MHYLILTFITITLWSSLALIVASLAHIPPFFLLATSLLIGGSFSIAQCKKWQWKPLLLFVGVSGIFGYHFLLFMALRLAPPVEANLLNYLWPLLILLFTPLFFKEKCLTVRQILGTCLSLCGAGLIVAQNGFNFSPEHAVGYSSAIIAAIIWACYSLSSKRLAQKYKGFGSATVGLFCLISGMFAAISHVFFEVSPSLTTNDSLLILLLGMGPLGLSFYCWDAAIKKGDPRVIASMSYFTPLLSTLMLIAFSKQLLSEQILIAMVLIILGALIANLKLKPARKFFVKPE